MKPITLSKGISITKTRRGNSQNCVACGQKIGEGIVAISLNNYQEDMSLKKNVWLHITCVNLLVKLVEKGIENNKENITVESI